LELIILLSLKNITAISDKPAHFLVKTNRHTSWSKQTGTLLGQNKLAHFLVKTNRQNFLVKTNWHTSWSKQTGTLLGQNIPRQMPLLCDVVISYIILNINSKWDIFGL
jgi:hypothetical protein